MTGYVVQHELRVLAGSADRQELGAALAVHSRNTSASLRTQSAQIQAKYEKPNNGYGEMYYVSLREGGDVVGFAMFGYYRRTRTVIIDHIAIDVAHRQHGSFFVFASLLQGCIEERCPDYDHVVVEIATDPEFARDGINGPRLVRLLRLVGFGQVHVRYDLPGLDARAYRKPHLGTMMVRGAQPIAEIRVETILDVHQAILFEHYLPWFADFLGAETPRYERQLVALREGFRARLKGKLTVAVNGGDHDELGVRRPVKARKVLGVGHATVGHVAAFCVLLLLVAAFQAIVRLDSRGLVATLAIVGLVYLALAAQSSVAGLKVFEKFGGIVTKAFVRR